MSGMLVEEQIHMRVTRRTKRKKDAKDRRDFDRDRGT